MSMERMSRVTGMLPPSKPTMGACSCPTLCNSVGIAHLAPLSMQFPRQEYWSGLPFPSPGGLPNPGIKPASPARQVHSLPLSHMVPPCKSTINAIYFMTPAQPGPFTSGPPYVMSLPSNLPDGDLIGDVCPQAFPS